MSDGVTDSQDWDVQSKANPVKWVISKYAPETGEKWEVRDEYHDRYIVAKDGYCYSFLKLEYIPTTPPERWEEVPNAFKVFNDGRNVCILNRHGVLFARGEEQFIIQDGKLVLQRRVSS